MLTINNSNTKKSLKSVKPVFNSWSEFLIISQCFFHTWSIIMASTTSNKPASKPLENKQWLVILHVSKTVSSYLVLVQNKQLFGPNSLQIVQSFAR